MMKYILTCEYEGRDDTGEALKSEESELLDNYVHWLIQQGYPEPKEARIIWWEVQD